jgi:3-mercaptopyruvate sulfurtransferase SseA
MRDGSHTGPAEGARAPRPVSAAPSPRSPVTGWLGRVAVLLGAGMSLGLLINRVHPHGVRFGSFAAPTACAAPASQAGAAPAPAVEVLSLAQVASLCGDPHALVADARSAERFAEGHVSGAIHLPCASSRLAASAALDLLAGKETLVVYGDGTDDALPVADELRRRSVRAGLRVAVLGGGFAAWSQAGLACSSGACAGCEVHR